MLKKGRPQTRADDGRLKKGKWGTARKEPPLKDEILGSISFRKKAQGKPPEPGCVERPGEAARE